MKIAFALFALVVLLAACKPAMVQEQKEAVVATEPQEVPQEENKTEAVVVEETPEDKQQYIKQNFTGTMKGNYQGLDTLVLEVRNGVFYPATVNTRNGNLVKLFIRNDDTTRTLRIPAYGIEEKLVAGQTVLVDPFTVTASGAVDMETSDGLKAVLSVE